MHLVRLDKARAALQLAKLRAQEILRTDSDPLGHLSDCGHLYIEADYCRELEAYGNLADEAYVAQLMGQSEQEIRTWVIDRLKKLADA